MLAKRIIPCLDIKDGRTVKGTNFIDLRDAGDPLELAIAYSKNGADELVFLDIAATNENRKTTFDLVYRLAENITIPFTVGGGIKQLEDIDQLMAHGADKVSLNTAAFHNPNLITMAANKYGSQAIVVAIDTKNIDNEDYVYLNGGRLKTNEKTLDWAKRAQELGSGEILLTSMDADGTKSGFNLAITQLISTSLNIPVIASGGAGTAQHFVDVFTLAQADAALAASIFHFREVEIEQLKLHLQENNIPVRL